MGVGVGGRGCCRDGLDAVVVLVAAVGGASAV